MLHRLIPALEYIPVAWRITAGAVCWLVIISLLHYTVNFKDEQRKVVTIGYMPVITNLAAPILDHASKEGDGIRFKALKFSSFAEMAESLRSGHIDVALMIAPLSVVLRQQGEDVKVVYIGMRHESTLVARADLNVKSLDDLSGKTIAVPMRYSGHNISILNLIESNGLNGRIHVVEMNSPDMASALASGSLDAYYVGEPFAAQTLKSGDASRLFYVEEVWENFICNLAVVRRDMIDKEPEVVEMLVHGAARSGLWAQRNLKQAAGIASLYWNQPRDLVEYALTTPKDRIVYDQFVPVIGELQYLADQMVKFNLLQDNDISGLVDDRFAKTADLDGISSLASVLSPIRRGDF